MHDGLNRITGLGHDQRQNLTAWDGRTFGYSTENLLRTVSGGVALTYDPLLRLSGIAVGGVGTVLGYDGTDRIAEYGADGAVLRGYVHGAGTDEPLVWYEGPGSTDRRWLHADERGSIVAVSDPGGAVIARNRYDEYGVPAPTNTGAFQYTGQTWLPEIGMYHYKARMYAPVLGRFLQTDPIGYAAGLNLYGYVGGDPVNFSDPMGKQKYPRFRGKDRYYNDNVRCPSGYYAIGDGCYLDFNSYFSSNPVYASGGGSVSPTPEPQKEKPILERLKNCVAAQYGFGDGETPTGIDLAKIGSEIASLPVFKPLVGIPVIGDSSRFTNVLNYTSFRLGLNARFEGAGLRSFAKSTFGSVRIATVLGRANVVVGGALLAFDAASITVCSVRD